MQRQTFASGILLLILLLLLLPLALKVATPRTSHTVPQPRQAWQGAPTVIPSPDAEAENKRKK